MRVKRVNDYDRASIHRGIKTKRNKCFFPFLSTRSVNRSFLNFILFPIVSWAYCFTAVQYGNDHSLATSENENVLTADRFVVTQLQLL